MRRGMPSLGRRATAFIRETWAELDYAQHRLLELSIGPPAPRRRSAQAQVDELEALFAIEYEGAAD